MPPKDDRTADRNRQMTERVKSKLKHKHLHEDQYVLDVVNAVKGKKGAARHEAGERAFLKNCRLVLNELRSSQASREEILTTLEQFLENQEAVVGDFAALLAGEGIGADE